MDFDDFLRLMWHVCGTPLWTPTRLCGEWRRFDGLTVEFRDDVWVQAARRKEAGDDAARKSQAEGEALPDLLRSFRVECLRWRQRCTWLRSGTAGAPRGRVRDLR